MSLGTFVREKRTAMHLTIPQLVKRLGRRWTIDRVSAVECDRALEFLRLGALTEEDFEALSEALDIDFDTLIDETDICPHCLGSGKREKR